MACDGDRAFIEVDVAVAKGEKLPLPAEAEDGDGHDSRNVLGHPRSELVDVVPAEKNRLPLVGWSDPDAVDTWVHGLSALLGVAEDALQQRQGHFRSPWRGSGKLRNEVLDERPSYTIDREVRERRETTQGLSSDGQCLRTRPDSAGRSALEAFEPLEGRVAEPHRSGDVERPRLALSLDVELERLRVLVRREGT